MKWILAILLALSILLTPGDVNFDGKVNVLDLTAVSRSIRGEHALNPLEAHQADVNRDGHIDISDLTIMEAMVINRGN